MHVLAVQLIETDVLIALALDGMGRRDEALDCIAATIGRAAPGGWLRPFLEPGRPMADLLARLGAEGRGTDYSRYLAGEIDALLARRAEHARVGTQTLASLEQGLRETLTNRELDILGLLADRLQNKEIARALSVSPETVKTHLKNLYAKLEVSNRREAAERAQTILRTASEVRPSDALA